MKKFPDHAPPEEGHPLYEFCRTHRFSPGVQTSRLFTAVLPCVTGFGSLYQAIAGARDRRLFPPPGSIFEVGGLRTHVQVMGSGEPTVVLESGLGGMSCAWAWIQPEVALFSRVVSYDRPGLGWSEATPAPGTARLAADRLRAILTCVGASPPFVLVGHSMGGLLIRVFVERYPNEVAGVVLIDAAHPDQHLRSPAIATHMRSGFRLLKVIPLLARLGYVRCTGLFDSWSRGLPAREAAAAKAFLASYRHLLTTRDESLAWDTLCSEVRATHGLGDIPLAVLTAGRCVLPGQPELQGELAALSSDSVHLTVREADHVTLVTRREYARAVVEAIRYVVGKALLRP